MKAIFKGYDRETLEKAFDLVADPADWRAPIFAWVPGEAVKPVAAAVEFFTATVPTIRLDVGRMLYAVEAAGYRAGPAGP